MIEETMGADCQASYLVDGPIDDYESWHGKLPTELHKDKATMYVHDLWTFKVGMCLTSYLEGTRPKPLLLKAAKRWYYCQEHGRRRPNPSFRVASG
jgi:hypothetical protein